MKVSIAVLLSPEWQDTRFFRGFSQLLTGFCLRPPAGSIKGSARACRAKKVQERVVLL